jgi:hypothetical protein
MKISFLDQIRLARPKGRLMLRDRRWIAALPLGLVATLLLLSQITPRSAKRVSLLERAGGLSRAQELVALNRARLVYLAEEEAAADAAPKPCVSWRGCSQYYNPEFQNVSAASFYDRFDR